MDLCHPVHPEHWRIELVEFRWSSSWLFLHVHVYARAIFMCAYAWGSLLPHTAIDCNNLATPYNTLHHACVWMCVCVSRGSELYEKWWIESYVCIWAVPYTSVYLSVCLSDWLVRLSIRASVCLSVYLLVCLACSWSSGRFACFPVCLSLTHMHHTRHSPTIIHRCDTCIHIQSHVYTYNLMYSRNLRI